MNELYHKQPVVNATYRLLAVIGQLKLARTMGLLWNIYPAADFVERNRHA